MVIKRFFRISTCLVILTYFVLMMIGFFRGTLSVRASVLMTVITVMIVIICYGLTKLIQYIDHKLYKELKRMMK
ncbi:hypothetical protein J14TS5_20300 [Paenibacillus lautus]|uniref:hypothetical protein n=1 Tax=Paenibacillus TaxID=44249 RepID=UPI001B017B63|nr:MULTISPECIES: hypothetical protein [Paenibacillus]GIO96944.1 hypothetical protein J14TS5_20300 [Paenibacillus lautus]